MYIIIRHNVLCEYAIFYNHFTNMCNDILNSECAKSTIEDRTKKSDMQKNFGEKLCAHPTLLCYIYATTPSSLWSLCQQKKLYP